VSGQFHDLAASFLDVKNTPIAYQTVSGWSRLQRKKYVSLLKFESDHADYI
jgi:hypothetical protein